MSGIEVTLRLVIGVALIAANGFFVAIEFAMTRVRQFPEREFDTPELRRAWDMTDNLEIYLTSCQVGITASSIAVGVVAEPALAGLFHPLFKNTVLASAGMGGLLAFVIINLLHLTHGEQTPTYLGVERTKLVCRYGAAPLYWFAFLVKPAILVGDSVAKWTLSLFGIEMTGAWLETEEKVIETRAQLRNRLSDLLEKGDLSSERHREVLSALTAGEQTVKDVMVPHDEIVYLSTSASIEENLQRIATSRKTRYPLIGDSPHDFIGIVYLPALFDRVDKLRDGTLSFEDVAAAPLTISVETTVSDAIDEFQEARQELALVLGDDEVAGLVTATDTLEFMVGELEDPLDAQETTEDTHE